MLFDDHTFRNPVMAAGIAAVVTVLYVYLKSKMNGQPISQNSEYAKPAFLVGLLVYFIVQQGNAHRESIAAEPF
jgi:hypothetical protein